MIRVLLVDDQALFREGLHVLLDQHHDLEVIAEAEDGRQAIALCSEQHPDVVLMDLQMPVLDGVAATREIRSIDAAPAIVVLTTLDDDERVLAAIRAGAVGYLLKDTTGDRLAEAVRAAARGESLLPPTIAAKLVAALQREPGPAAPPPELGTLTTREREILELIAEGLGNRAIAQRVHLSEGTVKNHVTHILDKLGVDSRTAAAALLRR